MLATPFTASLCNFFTVHSAVYRRRLQRAGGVSCCKSGAEVAALCMAVFMHCGPLKLQLKSSNRITLREEGREQRKDKVTDNWIAKGRLGRLNGGK